MKNWLQPIMLAALGIVTAAGAAKAATSEAGPYYSMPAWDQTFPDSSRWIVLTNMGSAAVLDRETGLVWQQNPSTNNFTAEWFVAVGSCRNIPIGNRYGWRVPSAEEMMTLLDPTTLNIFAGAPFTIKSGTIFWAATTDAQQPAGGYALAFQTGNIPLVSFAKSYAAFVWCVRGYQGTQNPQ